MGHKESVKGNNHANKRVTNPYRSFVADNTPGTRFNHKRSDERQVDGQKTHNTPFRHHKVPRVHIGDLSNWSNMRSDGHGIGGMSY